MKITPYDIFVEAEPMLDSDEKWCQNSWSRNKKGSIVPLLSKKQPCKVCLFGSMNRAFWLLTGTDIDMSSKVDADHQDAYDEAIIFLGVSVPNNRNGKIGIVGFNDMPETTYDEVRSVFRSAKALAKEKHDVD